MPNYSDLSVFKGAGMGGLNFAFGAGLAYYHTSEDTPENLDQRTLQHQGDNALATARHFGRLDLDKIEADDVVYTSILNRFVLSYRMVWNLPLALITVGAFIALAFFAIRGRQIAIIDVLMGAGLFIFSVIASWLGVGAMFFFGSCYAMLREARGNPPIQWLKYDLSIMACCALLAAIVTIELARFSALTRPLTGLILGAFSWWVALSLAAAIWLPNASYLFVWPSLGGLLGLFISSQMSPGAPMASAAAFLGSIPSLLLLAPLTRTTFDGLSLPMVQPVVVLVVFFTGTLMPLWGPLVAFSPRHSRTTKWKRSAPLRMEIEHAS
jgi:hypothetical protein